MNCFWEQQYNEIAANLINEYGEPKTEILMGRKHIVINEYLNAFNQFVSAFKEGFEKLNLPFEMFEEEFVYAMNYCKNAQYGEVYYLVRLLKKGTDKNFKAVLCNLRIAKSKNLPVHKVYNCIVTSFNIVKRKSIIYSPF